MPDNTLAGTCMDQVFMRLGSTRDRLPEFILMLDHSVPAFRVVKAEARKDFRKPRTRSPYGWVRNGEE